jgi:hypothetical protein
MSNPTYFVRCGDWRAVLRKQPGSVLLPSAHAIDREYRVLSALQGSDVPVPKPLHYCSDSEVLGTPFYLMEWLQGRVFHEFSTAGLRPDERAALFESMGARWRRSTAWISLRSTGRTTGRSGQLLRAPTEALVGAVATFPPRRRRQPGARSDRRVARRACARERAADAVPWRFPHRQHDVPLPPSRA